MRYIILATGPSVTEVIPKKLPTRHDIKIIGVNSSILTFKDKLDIWFSLDPSRRNITYCNMAAKKGILSYMAINKKTFTFYHKLHDDVIFLHRKSNDLGDKYRKVYRKPESPKQWFLRWGCLGGFSNNPGVVHSGNSAYGAMNLAYQNNPEKILLLGVDGSKEKSVGGMHTPNNLSHLPLLFESASKQLKKANIAVLNGSLNSTVECFPKDNIKNSLEWIRD